MAVTQAKTPLQTGPARPPRGEPARPPPAEPGLTLPGVGEKRSRKTMAEGADAEGTLLRVFFGFFTFVGLGDLRHFVQSEQRRGGTGAAPPLPLQGGAVRTQRAGAAEGRGRLAQAQCARRTDVTQPLG